MKTLNVQFTVIAVSLLMACPLLTGCGGINKATKLPKMSNQTVLVVPVQGEPVGVVSHHLGVSVMGGMISTAIERAATADTRQELAARLNRDAGDFKPDVILAEECAQLLKNSPVQAFRSATPQAESVVLPEAERLLMNETHPFKGKTRIISKWGPVFKKWFKGPPLAVSSQPAAADSALLCLEVYFNWLEINHGNEVDGLVVFRLVDHASRKAIGARSVPLNGYDIRPVTTDSDPATLKEDFRRLANQLAKKALTKMKLL